MTICIDENIDDIHPCTTKTPNIEDKTFPIPFQNDIYKLMNICNPTCYETYVDSLKNLCMYGFLQPLINEIHFNIVTRLSTHKLFHKWLNNANPWILITLKCNHELKFIATSNKNSNRLMYYITKTNVYISHMYFFL
jgi:hypothetical protein